jgi:hypothetical protein
VHKRKEVADNDAELAKNLLAEAERILTSRLAPGLAFSGLGATN